MKQRCCPRHRNSMKVDKNDIYGTYARGEGGEGDYGDGDIGMWRIQMYMALD